MAFQSALALSDLPPGSMRAVTVGGTSILVVREGDQVYAMEPRCGHAGGPLPQGTLQGHVVTCPWHGSQWDATNGRALYGPYHIPGVSQLWASLLPRRRTYAVRIADGAVQIDVEGRDAGD
jgi:nitrite reductase/ring-hydroxylating ferredoxin subunit